jgi:predicted metalloprotease
VDLTTLAALLGHSKLNMVMRYAHPQEQHQAETVKRLEAFNAAKEIAEVEAQKRASGQVVPTVFTTVTDTEVASPETAPSLN